MLRVELKHHINEKILCVDEIKNKIRPFAFNTTLESLAVLFGELRPLVYQGMYTHN